jgi:hypothetical protein
MQKIKIQQLMLFIALLCTTFAEAQDSFPNWELKMYAGYNLGGTSPIPLPAEIRKINSWSPGLAGTLGFQATRRLTPEWGITTGLAIDIKGMSIEADVKYMNTSIVIGEGEHTGVFAGMFTGKNKTTVRNGYLLIPLLGTYFPQVHTDWRFRLGGYFAWQRDANVEGKAYDGYIRNGGPAGDRINVDMSTFDFSGNVHSCDAGLMASTDWSFTRRLALTGQLTWGLVPLFPSDFNGIPYKMYNIYFMGGIAYTL